VVTIELTGLQTIHSHFGSGWEAAMPDEWPNKGDTQRRLDWLRSDNHAWYLGYDGVLQLQSQSYTGC